MNRFKHWSLGLLCLIAPAVSQAAFINFTATLTVDEEFPDPSVPSSATGSLTAILDTDTNVFTWILTATGLSAPTSAVHFHGNTPFPPGHTELARQVTMGFIGGSDPDVTAVLDTLSGATSGTYIGTADLDLALNDRGGDQPLTVAQQIQGLLNTQWYVNIHNANNPSGEIRGQVFLAGPIAAVPIPAVAWVLGLAFGALPLWAGRRSAV
jgi:hypothetical protein